MDNNVYRLCIVAIFAIFCMVESYIKYLNNKNGRL